MKKAVLTLGVLLLTILFINAQNEQQTQQTQPVVNPNAPKMEFQNLVHDYGTIQQNADGKCEFIFKNTGKEPLVISNARGSCGCTVPSWPHEPILPGQMNAIQVNYDTKRVGIINKTVTVESNASNSPIVLSIKGNILAPQQETTPVNQNNTNTVPK